MNYLLNRCTGISKESADYEALEYYANRIKTRSSPGMSRKAILRSTPTSARKEYDQENWDHNRGLFKPVVSPPCKNSSTKKL